MDRELFDIIMSHIVKLEGAIKQDIREIKDDLKELKEAQLKLTEVAVKLSTVEDKYTAQLNMCRDAQSSISKIKDEVADIEKRLIPIENFFEDFVAMKRKIVAGIILAIITGVSTFVINVLRWVEK